MIQLSNFFDALCAVLLDLFDIVLFQAVCERHAGHNDHDGKDIFIFQVYHCCQVLAMKKGKITLLQPPHIRTCRIPASGSSSHRLAG